MIYVHQNATLSESFEGDMSCVIGNHCKTVFSVRKHVKLFLEGKIEKKNRLLKVSTPNSIDQKCEKSVLIWLSLLNTRKRIGLRLATK